MPPSSGCRSGTLLAPPWQDIWRWELRGFHLHASHAIRRPAARGSSGMISGLGVQLAKVLGGNLWKQTVKVRFLQAVRLGASLNDGKDFNMPVIIRCDGFPIFA